MKYVAIALIILFIIVVAAYFLLVPKNRTAITNTPVRTFEECADAGYLVVDTIPRECHTKTKQVFVEIYNGVILKDVIEVKKPKPNEEVSSPFELSGQAVGDWYSSGFLNVKLVDEHDNILISKLVKATADTNTEGMVPFAAAIEYDASRSAIGRLIIERTNPNFTRGQLGPMFIPLRLKPTQ